MIMISDRLERAWGRETTEVVMAHGGLIIKFGFIVPLGRGEGYLVYNYTISTYPILNCGHGCVVTRGTERSSLTFWMIKERTLLQIGRSYVAQEDEILRVRESRIAWLILCSYVFYDQTDLSLLAASYIIASTRP